MPGTVVPGADQGVELPNFSYDAPVNSSNIVPVGGDRKRQPTTTIIHDVYVIPGERVDLIPYTDMWNRSNYFEDFYRYYDYKLDKAHDDVYFLFNPKAGAYNEHGIFGGRALGYVFNDRNYGSFGWNENSAEQRGVGGVASFYRPKEKGGLIDEYIAADFSQHYYIDGNLEGLGENETPTTRIDDVKKFLNTEAKTIHEPIINFRHVFHVIDGRTLADEMSKNRDANNNYINKNRRHISARAGVDFTMRLINAMPAEEGVKANFYYRKSDDGTYTRMGKYDIETYKYDNGVQGVKIDGMFGPDEHSAYYTPNIDLETELNPEGENTPQWVAANQKFYRAIGCSADNAKEGTYLIRFYAKDPNGERILLEDNQPLVLREIVVDFLGEDQASFTLENEIPETHKEGYLDSHYQAKSVVDFDKYMALSGTEYVEKDGNGERTKYPSPWMNSSYAFGYKYKQDYSTYMLASHADCVPYSQAATTDAGRYDRLWNNTKGEKQGFFYYANAAGDPGEMAHISIPNLCVGSTVHISAWVNSMGVYMNDDYTNNEPANVIFNLVAVTKSGRQINLNSFSSGYVPNDPEHCGKWMHVYGQITPNLSHINNNSDEDDEIDYFQVVLENNSLNSNGADYAIDDIRIYVAQPESFATQLKPLCNGEESTKLRVDMSFDKLLDTLGKSRADNEETAEEITLYYSIFDKEKLEDLSVGEDGNSKGFTEAIFNGSVLEYEYNDKTAKWGSLPFSTWYASMEEWRSDLDANMASRYSEDGKEFLSFNITPVDENLAPGKEYIVVFTVGLNNDEPSWTDFDVTDACSKQAEFTVRGSSVIKVDGIVKTGAEDLSICENQLPVVQVDILGIEALTGEPIILEECPLIDWFNGSQTEFAEAEFNGKKLDEALLNFRHVYPEALSLDQESKTAGDFSYNEKFKNTISHFIDNGKLLFASYSYVFDAIRFKENEKSVDCYVMAIPANRQEEREVDGKTYIICNDPTEIKITVDRRAPGLLDGFEGFDYPETVSDVPVRMGLKQFEKDLFIPLRNIYVVTEGVNQLIEMSEDKGIYLIRTNDPALRNLEADPGKNPDGTGLRQIGTVGAVSADINSKSNGNAKVRFDNDNPMKEGYFYTLRLNYREKPESGMLPEDVCDGQLAFTVKVVAEYQMWTGSDSQNFNNDNNWRRVSSEELLATTSKDGYTTDDDKNENTFSYSPLDFTKIIIPSGEKYPHLFKPGESSTYHVFDGNREIDVTHPTGLSDNSGAGVATSEIEYDLTAKDVDGILYCRPWYANTCEQIHFLANSEIMNQQHLIYEKAWVDMEMEPSRWYTASSPLQSVVAGDMYLPTDGARQNTELFQEITFQKGINDRFAPAVYQRGWDRGVANVYELPSNSNNEITNVAVSLDWSNVFNDVQEKYNAGLGYSIKTDVTDVKSKPELVSFRLPKADTAFEYWTQDGNDHGTENGGLVTRDKAYRLNDVNCEVKLTNANGSKYFLAGNPFMAHVDMKKFLDVNSSVINPKYWIMNGDSQTCAVMDENSNGFIGSVENASVLPPMQGFFVEAKAGSQEIMLKFTEDMLTTLPGGPVLQSFTRSGDDSQSMMISVLGRGLGSVESKAVVNLSGKSSRSYAKAEDVLMLDDRDENTTRVYTVAGNNAVSINSTPDADGMEIGILADENAMNILRFDNVEAFSGLSLFDAESGTMTPLSEGMEYEVKGTASGRLYLASAALSPADNSNGVSIEVRGSEVVATSSEGGAITLAVHDVSGKLVASANGINGTAMVVNLDKGLYIVVAKTGRGTKSPLKIMIQ